MAQSKKTKKPKKLVKKQVIKKIKTMPKKIIKVPKVELEAVAPVVNEPTSDELELKALRELLDGMESRGIHDVGTLVRYIARLAAQIQKP